MNNPADSCPGNLAPLPGKRRQRYSEGESCRSAGSDVRSRMHWLRSNIPPQTHLVFLTKDLQNFTFGSVQLPRESLSCGSGHSSPTPLCWKQSLQKLGSQILQSCGSSGDFPVSQEWPHNNPPWHGQQLAARALHLQGKAVPQTQGSGFGVGEMLRHSQEDHSLPPSFLARFPDCLLLSLLCKLFLSPLDVQLPD